MLVLLSSAHSPRYREDILRCLAAPIGSEVQFRYDKRWVSDALLGRIGNRTLTLPAAGIVCYVDLEGSGPLTLIPVRGVEVVRVNVHGRSISLVLSMKDVHYAVPADFTPEIASASANASPTKNGDSVSGKYFFEISALPPSLKTGRTIGDWEQTVTLLREQPAFHEEPFFWTTVGVEREGEVLDSNILSPWPSDPIVDPFDVLVYHYQPKPGPRIDSKLSITGGTSLEHSGPSEVDIDSRYDLKRWRFHPRPTRYKSRETWLRVRTANRWNLDLRLSVKGPFGSTLLKAIMAGFLIAIPTTASAFMQKDASLTTQLVVTGISIVAGILAACAVVFSVEKIA